MTAATEGKLGRVETDRALINLNQTRAGGGCCCTSVRTLDVTEEIIARCQLDRLSTALPFVISNQASAAAYRQQAWTTQSTRCKGAPPIQYSCTSLILSGGSEADPPFTHLPRSVELLRRGFLTVSSVASMDHKRAN
jgi:hypothetical protein